MTDDLCRAVHEATRALPRVAYPFAGSDLPRDGIYFFFEAGEYDAHTGDERIVRVGTHRNGNFRSRISEHYLLGKELDIVADRPAPKGSKHLSQEPWASVDTQTGHRVPRSVEH